MHINRPTNFQQLMELSISDLARLDTLTDVTLVPGSGEKVRTESVRSYHHHPSPPCSGQGARVPALRRQPLPQGRVVQHLLPQPGVHHPAAGWVSTLILVSDNNWWHPHWCANNHGTLIKMYTTAISKERHLNLNHLILKVIMLISIKVILRIFP